MRMAVGYRVIGMFALRYSPRICRNARPLGPFQILPLEPIWGSFTKRVSL